jgi:hypothetical protein
MTDKEFQKRYEYSFVHTNKKDDLRWVKAIIYMLRDERKITHLEHNNLSDSLVMIQ